MVRFVLLPIVAFAAGVLWLAIFVKLFDRFGGDTGWEPGSLIGGGRVSDNAKRSESTPPPTTTSGT